MQRMRTRAGSTLCGALAVMIGVGLWMTLRGTPALAQVPDSGAQRNEMLAELRESNRKLSEIATLLREIRDAQRPPASPAPATKTGR
jgi:hypothetical protein